MKVEVRIPRTLQDLTAAQFFDVVVKLARQKNLSKEELLKVLKDLQEDLQELD